MVTAQFREAEHTCHTLHLQKMMFDYISFGFQHLSENRFSLRKTTEEQRCVCCCCNVSFCANFYAQTRQGNLIFRGFLSVLFVLSGDSIHSVTVLMTTPLNNLAANQDTAICTHT